MTVREAYAGTRRAVVLAGRLPKALAIDDGCHLLQLTAFGLALEASPKAYSSPASSRSNGTASSSLGGESIDRAAR
jgi:hypothetical protein